MADRELLETVWGETIDLRAKDGTPETLARLHTVVAKLADAAKTRGPQGYLRRLTAPDAEDARLAAYLAMKDTVNKAEAAAWQVNPALPARAALWEMVDPTTPRREPPPPRSASWIFEAGVGGASDFVDSSNGRTYRLFESSVAPAEGVPPFVSMASGSGLPKARTAQGRKRLGWVIGIAASIVFIAGAALSTWSGASMSGAYNLLRTDDPAQQSQLLAAVARTCEKDRLAFANGNHPAICDKLLTADHALPPVDKKTQQFIWTDPAQVASVLTSAAACPGAAAVNEGCTTMWRAAVDVDQSQGFSGRFLGWLNEASAYLTGTSPAAGTTSILVPFLMLTIGIAGLVIALGIGTKNRVAGVWIDTRNRVSLARAQVTLWTIVALAGYAALTMFNIGFAGIVGAGDLSAYQAFPLIPASIAAALGIAAASPMISSLILQTKPDAASSEALAIRGGSDDTRTRGAPFFGAESAGLDTRESPAAASIADIFMGEELANNDTVDVSRLQNVVITVTLVSGFFSMLVGMTNSITAAKMIGTTAAPFASLPVVGATFTSLLLVSHATYLATKARDATDPKPKDGAGK